MASRLVFFSPCILAEGICPDADIIFHKQRILNGPFSILAADLIHRLFEMRELFVLICQPRLKEIDLKSFLGIGKLDCCMESIRIGLLISQEDCTSSIAQSAISREMSVAWSSCFWREMIWSAGFLIMT